MLSFGWAEILLVLIVVIIFVGPKELPKLIKQLSSFTKSIKKLSREFKSSLNEIADQEEFKEINKSIMEVKDLKEDFNIKKNLENEINSIKETSNLVEKDLHDINLFLDVNHKRHQTGNTNQMIFNFNFLVSHISSYITLMPGDIVTTGTPPGVGLGMVPPVFLKNWDLMNLSVDYLGQQKIKFVAE